MNNYISKYQSNNELSAVQGSNKHCCCGNLSFRPYCHGYLVFTTSSMFLFVAYHNSDSQKTDVSSYSRVVV